LVGERATTDGRYVEVAPEEWWDTTGVEIVPETVVEAHLDRNPRVGVVVFRRPATH
jgi:hypothetical protein